VQNGDSTKKLDERKIKKLQKKRMQKKAKKKVRSFVFLLLWLLTCA
jgi:hypothetical protein